jgi:hypothetical protein
MIQSGFYPTPWQNIRHPFHREAIGIIEYRIRERDENHTLDRLWNARRKLMGIHMYMGLALKNILVDVTEDYRKMYSASDKTKLVDIQKLCTWQDLQILLESEIKAGLAERDNYKKRPILMLRTRCITLRLYAADIFMGIHEMIDVTESSYELDDVWNASRKIKSINKVVMSDKK